MIVYVSFVPASGATGYGHIGTHLCAMLNNYDRVVCLSLDYNREEHWFDYPIIPTDPKSLVTQVNGLIQTKGAKVRLIVLAMDIPMMVDLLAASNFGGLPRWGIFPVEAGPLCESWTNGLWGLNERFVISKFGKQQLDEVGLPSHYLPIPPNAAYNYISDFDPTEVRESLGISKDSFVFISVADNQERKNLSAAFEIFAKFNKVVSNSHYVLVTRMDSRMGWNLDDLARSFGIKNKVRLLDRKQPIERLANLYRSSNVMLITSKAEGLCMPMLEAMACGLPVVGTDCTAMADHLQHGGIPIPPVFSFNDTFGNSTRYFIDQDKAVEQLLLLHSLSKESITAGFVEPALEYIKGFSWQSTLDVLLTPMGKGPTSSILSSPVMVPMTS